MSKFPVWLLVCGLVAFGTSDVAILKLTDKQKADGVDGVHRSFKQPFLQSMELFVGQIAVLVVLTYQQRKQQSVAIAETSASSSKPAVAGWHLFVLPGIAVIASVSLELLGLTMIYASIFQMIRGIQTVFVALFSVVLRYRKLVLFHWLGIAFVVIGLVLVGASSLLSSDANSEDNEDPLLGLLLVLASQLLSSMTIVYSERIFLVYKGTHPLRVIGVQGVIGFVVLSVLLVMFQLIPGRGPQGVFVNTLDGLTQIRNSGPLLALVIANTVSVALFQSSQIALIKQLSGAHATVLNQLRNVLVWVVSLCVGWEKFHWLQLLGLLSLVWGNLVFNEAVRLPCACLQRPPEPHLTLNEDSGAGVQESLLPTDARSEPKG